SPIAGTSPDRARQRPHHCCAVYWVPACAGMTFGETDGAIRQRPMLVPPPAASRSGASGPLDPSNTCRDDRASPLQRRPHGAVALGRPHAGGVDALGLVVGAGDVEGLAVLENGPARVLGTHGGGRLVEALLERRAAS